MEPRENPAPRAVWRAAGAREVLTHATVVDSVDEAIADCSCYCTSARERRIPWPLINREWRQGQAEAQKHKAALLFGRKIGVD